MSKKRLQARVRSATGIGMASLKNHKLRFHKIGKSDYSAKCDAEHTKDPNHYVIGVVYEIVDAEMTILDQIEGHGSGYERKMVFVELEEQEKVEVVMYYATNIDYSRKPFHWYKEHVLIGAREHGLPASYINEIESIVSIDDPDTDRCETELAIYREDII